MDLSTNYLGLQLKHPIMPGASPMVEQLDVVRQLEDAGAAAIVMHSLFEEQIVKEQIATADAFNTLDHAFGEAMTFLADSPRFELGPDEYLERVRQTKEAVDIPVIASLNGTTEGGWLKYAKLIEATGADALELNVYDVVTDPSITAQTVEDRLIAIVKSVAAETDLPLAVKLGPFFTALPNLAVRLVDAGAKGLVLFNRFYQPDIDLEELEMTTTATSERDELQLRLRWLGILAGRVDASLAATGGAHTGTDVIKALMCGADVVQMVTAILRTGPAAINVILEEVNDWLAENEYESLTQLRGSMSMTRCPHPQAYQRANYVRLLHSWK